MKGEQVKAIIKSYGPDAKIELMATAQRLYTGYKGCKVAFNDEQELYIAAKLNEDAITCVAKPFEVSCGSYDDISSITAIGTFDETKQFILNLKANGMVTADEYDELLNTMIESGIKDTYAATTSIENIEDRVGAKPTIYSTDSYGQHKRLKLDEPKPTYKVVGVDGTVMDKETTE